MSAAWEELEEHVQHIYSMLLNLKDENIAVARDVVLKGRDGLPHQFDVYYEFSRAGVSHRVAIECKNKSRPIEKDAVMAFRSKVSDVVGLQGIIVAANGFQSGAKKYAEDNGILAIHLDELPNSIMLMAERLEHVALPDETTIGEPFWSLYHIENGRETGSLYSGMGDDGPYVVLFFSKLHASSYLDSLHQNVRNEYAVRGLPQRCLRSFILLADMFNSDFVIAFCPESETDSITAFKIARQRLIEEYYIGSGEIPKEPMVMPDLERWRSSFKSGTLNDDKGRNMRTFIDILRSQSEISINYESFLKF